MNKKHFFSITVIAFFLCSVLALSSSAKTVSDEITFIGRNGLATMENGEALVEIYDRIEDGVDSLSEEINIRVEGAAITAADLRTVFDAYRNDHPEAFYLSNSYSYTSSFTKIFPKYIFDIEDIPKKIEKFSEGAEELLRGIPEGASDYEISQILHDRIANRVTYEESDHAHNAYGAIVDDEVVCEGYARAYQYLLNKMGITSAVVTGWSKNEAHAWNIVELDGKYYYTDVTWDDQDYSIYYAYLNVTREMMEEDHYFDTLPYDLPDADSLDANYFEVNGGFTDKNGLSVEKAVELLKRDNCLRLYVLGNNARDIMSWFRDNFSEIGTKAFEGSYLTSASTGAIGREYVFTFFYEDGFKVSVSDGEASRVEWEDDGDSDLVPGATVIPGMTVEIEAEDPPFGAHFDKWVVTEGNVRLLDPYSEETFFIMPTGNVTIKATYYYEKTMIVKHPENASVLSQGESPVFRVEAEGKNLSFAWYIKGGALGDTPVKVGDNSPVYTYPVSAGMCLDNGAEIYCAVTGADSATVVSESAVLTVNHAAEDSLKSDENGHFYLCACGAEINRNAHIHSGATCTEKDICTVCSAVLADENGHTPGAAATCTEDQICTVCSAVLSDATGHTPGTAATCTEDQICTVCSAVLDEADGHVPETRVNCDDVIKCTVCGDAVEAAKEHAPGVAATCTEAQTCTICGKVLAEATGHTPGAEATCTEAQTCTVCGDVLAEAFTHTPGTDATCTEAKKCTVCNFEIEAAKGHNFETKFTVDKEASYSEPGEKSYHCTRCDERSTVTVIPQLIDSSSEFDDVKEGDWYKEYVDFALSNSLMSGTGDRKFAPNTSMSRAMLVTVLWRLEGSPEVEATHSFTDLEQDWYKTPVAWAYENEIVLGKSETEFAPNAKITREQMAAILYRYSQYKGYDTETSAELDTYPDGDVTSNWAVEALSWANGAGLITGSKKGDENVLDPGGSATRAQVATILMRFIQNL